MKKAITNMTLAALSLSLLLCGCSTESTRNPTQTSGTSIPAVSSTPPATSSQNGGGTPVDSLPGSRGTLLALEENDALSISRLKKESEAASGEKGIWTVLVYMCATDLESDQGSATDDLNEMIDATRDCANLRFVVEADGTDEWFNDLCKPKTKQRFVVKGGEIEEVYSGKSTNMGLSSTLSDFLKWSLEKYSSEFMVLDLWNHGGGSITGVCFDENNDFDSLSLKEIDTAIASVFGNMTGRFELIGCDACLMATAEMANMLTPYAKYMLASQNLESGNGWDYTSFAKALKGGASNGGDLGKYICDGYYEACVYTDEEYDATLSVIDLSKTDEFLTAFNSFSKKVYEYAYNNSVTDIIKAGKSSLNFGGNNKTEGYTNMIDAGDFLALAGASVSEANDEVFAALKALDNCIVYSKNGIDTANASGLCIYYPLSVQGSNELDILKDICISPYYLSLVDLCAYGSSNNGSVDGYEYDSWTGDDTGFWSNGSISGSGYGYWESADDGINFDVGNSALTYEVTPHLDSEGSYTFKLTDDCLYDLDTVRCNIMMSYWEEGSPEMMLDLGTDDFVDLDWDTGVCKDNFDGSWFTLPDGQPLCVYLVETNYDEDDYYNIYTAPIYLNEEYTNLKIKQSYKDSGMTTEILGAWDGISENGSAARELYQLKAGDIIEPYYDAYDAVTYEYVDYYYGDKYIYDGNSEIGMGFLPDGDYYYSFEIYDYYGNGLYTDFVLFGIEGDELYYYYGDE